jgi:hypothetical protein
MAAMRKSSVLYFIVILVSSCRVELSKPAKKRAADLNRFLVAGKPCPKNFHSKKQAVIQNQLTRPLPFAACCIHNSLQPASWH